MCDCLESLFDLSLRWHWHGCGFWSAGLAASCRLGAENTEGPVILVDPGEAVLVRGQLLKLEDGKILELLEGPKKKEEMRSSHSGGWLVQDLSPAERGNLVGENRLVRQ